MEASSSLEGSIAEVLRVGATAVVFVRHARTGWNADGRFLGRSDVPLDAIGRRQAEALANRLRVDAAALYTSPLGRARETAAQLGSYRVVADLAELDQGELEGLEAMEAFRRFPDFFAHWARDPATAPTPGGETFSALRERAVSAVQELAAEHRGGIVVVVSHQMVGAALGCAASGVPLDRWRDHRLPNVGLKLLGVDAAEIRCVVPRLALVEEVQDG